MMTVISFALAELSVIFFFLKKQHLMILVLSDLLHKNMALISTLHKLQTDHLKESAKAVTKYLAN